MAISTITPAASSSAPGQTPNASSALDMTEFLKLLTVQLSSQDPLDPTSDSAFFAQLAQMGTVQGVNGIQQSMQITQAAAMMGKTVSAVTVNPATGSSESISGVVTKLTISNGQYYLNVKDSTGNVSIVPLANVQTVEDTPVVVAKK